jgi:hypothetical protein
MKNQVLNLIRLKPASRASRAGRRKLLLPKSIWAGLNGGGNLF